MSFKLYKIDGSGPVRAVLMTAEALQIKFDTQDVDLFGGEHLKPEYLEKNPAHTVPMIEEDNFVLADSHAIITYLASKYGGEKLYPSDLRIRATIIQRLFFEATTIHKAYSTLINGILREGQTAPTPEQIKAVNDGYEILDKYLQKTKFVACDHVTLADIACVASVSTLGYWIPVDDKFKNVKAWWKNLEKEDWYKKGNLPGMAAYAAYFDTKFNKSA
nr:glutathione S-transferase epsilon 3 [Agrotis ipsilon]